MDKSNGPTTVTVEGSDGDNNDDAEVVRATISAKEPMISMD